MISTSVPSRTELALLTFIGWHKLRPPRLYEVRTVCDVLTAVWIIGLETGAQGLGNIKEGTQGTTRAGLHPVCTLKEGSSLPKWQYPDPTQSPHMRHE